MVVFGSSDWEAGFERWGTQGASATFPNFLCNVKNQHLSHHGSSLSAHNHKTSVCVTRSKASFKNDLLGQVEGLHMGFTSLEDFESHVDLAERTEIERENEKKWQVSQFSDREGYKWVKECGLCLWRGCS